MAEDKDFYEAQRPFTAFAFRVELDLGDKKQLCGAYFSECDGLEMNITPKTIREGGNNARPIHLMAPVSYGQLTLKRGMTANFDLWDWFEQVQQTGSLGLRATGTVVMVDPADQDKVRVKFSLEGCLPVKLKAPALSGKDGQLAIEEMQIAYERLKLER